MTKHSCDVVQDLLPLYLDGCCHPGSRALVEEHLKECPDCERVRQEMAGEIPAPEEPQTGGEAEPAKEKPEQAPEQKRARTFRKGMKKIRRRWIASLVVVIILVPFVILGINQVREYGLCYTNLHEFYLANAFLGKMKAGDYEGAAEYINREDVRERYLFSWFTEDEMENFDQDVTDTFVAAAQGYTEMGGLSDYRFHWGGYASATVGALDEEERVACYRFDFQVTVGGKDYRAILEVSDDGVEDCWIYDNPMGGPQKLNAINEWEYTLWDEYVARYFDEERKSEYTCFAEEQAYEGSLNVAADG